MTNKEHLQGVSPLIPVAARVIKVVEETPDVKTLWISKDEMPLFSVNPGQLAMLSLPGIGEAMFSVTDIEEHLELSIKKVGHFTEMLHNVTAGQMVGVRGPYGNGFPVDSWKGKRLLFIAGGIGMAPVRSLIRHCIKRRADFSALHLIYGARNADEMVYKQELFEVWPLVDDFTLSLTVDRATETWQGHVGFVPSYLRELNPVTADTIGIVCGPPIMIKYTIGILRELGFAPESIFTTLEMRMKCGIGKCGRCNIGPCYVCLDGPVFSQAQLIALPDEY